MKKIGLTASEEMSFENVDRRTDGRLTNGRTTDTFIYHKLTNEPSAQVSLKIKTLWLMVTKTSGEFSDNPNLKSRSVSIPYIMSTKKFSNQYLVLKAKGKTKSNHKILGL